MGKSQVVRSEAETCARHNAKYFLCSLHFKLRSYNSSYNSLGVAPEAIALEDILVRAAGEPKFGLVACSAT